MSTVEVPHSELPQTPQFIQPDADRATSYKPKEITNKLFQADHTFLQGSLSMEKCNAYLDELYAFLEHANSLPNDSGNAEIAEAEQQINESYIRTEIARIRRYIYLNERSSLSNTKELALWQTVMTSFLRGALRIHGPEKPRKYLEGYWRNQERIFSAKFPKTETTDLEKELRQLKRGVLAAVAFEESMTNLKGWNIQPANPKLDAGRAIDYVIESPKNKTFFIQLTSTIEENAPAAACGQVMEKRKEGNVSEKEMRFRRGVSVHISKRRIDPSTVRAVFITLSQKYIDQVSGVPERIIQQELTEALVSIEDRHGGWEDAGKPSYMRKPR